MRMDAGRGVQRAKAVLVLDGLGRRESAQRLKLSEFVGLVGLSVVAEVVFRRRRRSRPSDQLRCLLPDDADVVVVETLGTLAQSPLAALEIAAATASEGFALLSLREPWLSSITGHLPTIGEWLSETLRLHRSRVARRAGASASAAGRRSGRPRKVIDLAVAVPHIQREGVARTAAKLGVGTSTLRRALAGSGFTHNAGGHE
jgi:hypothetical protein